MIFAGISRAGLRTGLVAAGVWVTGLAAGCSPKIKAVEVTGQTVLRDGKAALIERQGLAVVVTPARVRLDEDNPLVGMHIEIINQTTRPVRMTYRDVRLIGGDGLARPAMHPKRFQRYADLAQGDPPPAVRPAPRVYVGVGYGGYHYHPYGPYWHPGPGYYYDYYDAREDYYRRRERVARFVTSLWREQTIQPGYVGDGYVVFDYELRKDDRFEVELELDRMPTTQPVTAPTTRPLIPVEEGRASLRFHFET